MLFVIVTLLFTLHCHHQCSIFWGVASSVVFLQSFVVPWRESSCLQEGIAERWALIAHAFSARSSLCSANGSPVPMSWPWGTAVFSVVFSKFICWVHAACVTSSGIKLELRSQLGVSSGCIYGSAPVEVVTFSGLSCLWFPVLIVLPEASFINPCEESTELYSSRREGLPGLSFALWLPLPSPPEVSSQGCAEPVWLTSEQEWSQVFSISWPAS